jgi:hypothetical protein
MVESDPVFNKMGKKKHCVIIYCHTMLSGESKEAMLHIAKKYYRKHVFPIHHVLEHMDYAGGVFNSAGVELVREMEISKLPVLKQKKYSREMCP